MQKGMDYLLREHDITLRTLAKNYKWLVGNSWQDLYHDLLISVTESLEKYKGNMTNMNSLVTLLARRYIHDCVREHYNGAAGAFCVDIDSDVLETCVSIEVITVEESFFFMDFDLMDEEIKKFIAYSAIYGYKKALVDLKVERKVASSFIRRAKKLLSDYQHKSNYNHLEYLNG
jgi:hypothetical protein